MIKLYIQSQQVDLKPSTAITLTEKRDLFNLAIIGGSFSVPFDIAASTKNRRIFSFIDDPAASTPFEKEYDASLYFSDAITLEGKYVLRKASKKKELNGYFKTDAGALSSFANTTIRTLINDTTTYTVNSLTDVNNANANPANDIVFPRHVQIIADGNNVAGSGTVESAAVYNPPRTVLTELTIFRPCLKLTYILDLVAESLGYTVQYNFSNYAIEQAIWIPSNEESRRTFVPGTFFTFPFVWKINELIPNITFSELLSSLRANFNLCIVINANTRTIVLDLVQDLITTQSIDFTSYQTNETTIESIEAETTANELTFSVPPVNEVEEFEQLSPVSDYSAAIGAGIDVNKIRIIESDCRYFQVTALYDPITDSTDYEYIPFENNTVGGTILGLSESVESKLSPIPSEQAEFRNFEGLELVNNGSGKVRLKINSDALLGTGAAGTIEARLIGQDSVYNKKFVAILAASGTFMDLDINYIEDETIDLQTRKIGNFANPLLRSQYEAGAQGGIAMYHGISDTIDTVSTYAYASSSAYDTDFSTQLSNAAFIFETDLGLFSQYYQQVTDTLGDAIKKATFTLWLPIHLLPKRSSLFIISNGVKYLVTQFKYKLSNRTKERIQCTIESRIA